MLTYTRAFRIGDRIRVNDSEGAVINRPLIATRVCTIKNVDIVIPNAVLLGNHMINYSTVAEEQGLILHSKVTIGYDVPWRAMPAENLSADYVAPPFRLNLRLDASR